ncbi:MAG: hypothetical protein V3S43_06190 [Acidimicrobiia bacterium]
MSTTTKGIHVKATMSPRRDEGTTWGIACIEYLESYCNARASNVKQEWPSCDIEAVWAGRSDEALQDIAECLGTAANLHLSTLYVAVLDDDDVVLWDSVGGGTEQREREVS